MHQTSVPSRHPQRVLVIKLRHHGDMLLITPVLNTLHKNYPDAQIDVVLYQETETMLAHHPYINRRFVIDRNWKKLGLKQQLKHEWQLLKTLRQRQYDLVINLADQWRSALMTRFTGAPIRLGFDYPKRESRLWRCAHTQRVSVADHDQLHTVEQNLRLLAPLGLASIITQATMSYHPTDLNTVNALLARHHISQPYIVVHPASRWFFKCWSEENMARLIDRLADAGKKIVLTSGPDLAERQMVDKILTLCHNTSAVSLAGKTSLPQLAALIDQATLFIGVDSVPMHMAAALKTPHVALFGPTKLKLWHPWEGESTGEIIWAGDFGPLPDPDNIDTNTTERYLDAIPLEAVLEAVWKCLK